eukprot:symbB.v1.2.014653.t1/scaffold1063.1/size201213/8
MNPKLLLQYFQELGRRGSIPNSLKDRRSACCEKVGQRMKDSMEDAKNTSNVGKQKALLQFAKEFDVAVPNSSGLEARLQAQLGSDVHLRTENWDAADQACRQCLSLTPQCDDLLVEMATEFHRKERQFSLAEACTRTALSVKDTGQGHGVLADILAQMGKAEASVLEAQTALKMLVEQPDLRKAIFGKALKICQDLDDKPLTEALHACQKLAEEQYAGRKTLP